MDSLSQTISDNAAAKTLPEEIVTDIISRLPVKLVYQLQSLSKKFSFITKDHYFINTHLKQSSELRPSIIFNSWNKIYLIRCSNMLDSEFTVEEVPIHHSIDFPNSPESMIEIVGSCNGLVLVIIGDPDTGDFFLWNPATIQWNLLPSPSHVPHLRYVQAFWGFGYCTNSKGYKIVRVAYYSHLGETFFLAEVLRFEADLSWRRIDFSKFNMLCLWPGITVKGVVYWAPARGCFDRLLAFDLAVDEFSWIFIPVQKYSSIIMEFRGSLALCSGSETNINSFDVWVLKDIGCSWEKIFTTVEFPPSLEPVRFLNDRQLFLLADENKYEDNCFMYDLYGKEIKQIPGIKLLPWLEDIQVYKYADSLVSLNGTHDDSIYDISG